MENDINSVLIENNYGTILLDKRVNKGKTIIEKFQ
jgi:hypothetical protein